MEEKDERKWTRRNSQIFVNTWLGPKARWHKYWEFPLRPSRALNRAGEEFPLMSNAKRSFYWPWGSPVPKSPKRVGKYGNVLWKQGKIARLGNSELKICAGSSMAPSAMARPGKAGERRWRSADDALCSRTCSLILALTPRFDFGNGLIEHYSPLISLHYRPFIETTGCNS